MTEVKNAKEIFLAAIEISAPEERRIYLEQACGEDATLLARVNELVAAHEQPAPTLDRTSEADEPAPPATGDFDESHARIGDQIGPYRLREVIGQGGMGTVYVAQQEQPLRRKVALKVIKRGMDTQAVIARFEAERQALAIMDHPNIARVLDAGETEHGLPFFVMELVQGTEITSYCDDRKLSISDRLKLFTSVCHAIKHAHQKGIIHRDIKPSNVLVAEQDGEPIPKVIDFGVAKAIGGQLTDHSIYTGFQAVIGTPLYMSPEQAALSNVDVDTRSDVYSLGVLLYELLTGTTPIDRSSLKDAGQNEVLRIIREQEPPKPSTRISSLGQSAGGNSAERHTNSAGLSRTVRGELDWIVMKALEKDRSRRYESTTQLADDIQNYLCGRAVTAGPPSAWYHLRKTVRRHHRAVTALATFFLFLAVVASLLWFKNIELQNALTETERAETESLSLNAFFIGELLGKADPDANPYQEKTTVVDLLDRAASKLENSAALDGQPLVEASIRLVLGKTYYALGQWRKGKTLLQHALAIREKQISKQSPLALEAREWLLRVQLELEEYDAAIASAEFLEASWRGLRGDADPHTVQAGVNRARGLMLQGKYPEAEDAATTAVGIAERPEFPDYETRIHAWQTLADVLSVQYKEYQRAFSLYEQCLSELRARNESRQSSRYLTLQLRQIEHLIALDRVAEAETVAREIVETRAALTLPSDHPNTIASRVMLGNVLTIQGKLTAGSTILREAHQQAAAALGEEHQLTWLARRTLLMSLNAGLTIVPNRGELLEEAEQLAKANLRVAENCNWAASHSNMHQSRTDLALIMAAKGFLEKSGMLGDSATGSNTLQEAEASLQQIYKESLAVRGPTHSLTIASGHHWAQTRLVRGDSSEEFEALIDEMRQSVQETPKGFPFQANLLLTKGQILARRGRHAESEPYARDYLTYARSASVITSFDKMSAALDLFKCLANRGRVKPLRQVEFQPDAVYHLLVTRPDSTPQIVLLDANRSVSSFANHYDEHQAHLFFSSDVKKTLTPIAASFGSAPKGEYQLTVQECKLADSTTVEGETTRGEQVGRSFDGSFHSAVVHTMKAGNLYRISASATGFRTALRVDDPNGRYVGWPFDSNNSSNLDFSPPVSGDYAIVVFPAKRGPGGKFSLTIQEFAPQGDGE